MGVSMCMLASALGVGLGAWLQGAAAACTAPRVRRRPGGDGDDDSGGDGGGRDDGYGGELHEHTTHVDRSQYVHTGECGGRAGKSFEGKCAPNNVEKSSLSTQAPRGVEPPWPGGQDTGPGPEREGSCALRLPFSRSGQGPVFMLVTGEDSRG